MSFFLFIHGVLAAHRRLSTAALLLLVAVFAALALRMDYEEDISRFLPTDDSQQAYQQAVEQLSSQNRIVVCFTGDTEAVKQAMDRFETLFEEADTAQTVTDLQVTVDETQMLDLLAFVSSNAPYFLTADDYAQMDSLLAVPGYVADQLTIDKQLLQLPTGGLAVQTLAHDPLHLFTPLLGRLQTMGHNSRFMVDDGYVFTRDGRHGLAFLTSPYGTSETARNAELAAMLDKVIERTEAGDEGPAVSISAVGGPLIAVSNATQIKRDSMLAVSISVVLIVVLLVWHYRRLHELLWIVLSLGFGWLFAIAGMSLLRDSVSIIVLGIGSVIIGIAVNYPLHYLDHLRETGDQRQTLCDMVKPLLIGNVTTVSAFLCLLWVDAAAMRDLGLFGSLMLVGTILFVLVVLPQTNKTLPRPLPVEGGEYKVQIPPSLNREGMGVGLLLTLLFGYFSLQTSFDSDLRHINYMTDEQREGMELLASLSEDMPQEMTDLIPSQEVQQQRLQLWMEFQHRHATLLADLAAEGARQGFTTDAFQPFRQLMTSDLCPQAAAWFEPVGKVLGGQHLINAKNVGNQLVEILQSNFNYVSYVCGFVVFVFLWLSFGSIELALLSFLPLAVSWIWILGLMQLLGIQFNIVNIILATFIFGQGDDYTIFITEGLVYEYATGRRRLSSYRRSVVLSATLMFIGIGTLILAKHPALRSLAEVTIVGMGTVVVMAYYLPPLVFRWLTKTQKTHKPHKTHPRPLPVEGGENKDHLPPSLNREGPGVGLEGMGVGLPLPITLRRVAYSLFAMGFFLVAMYLFMLPYTWLYFHLGKATEERKLKYHRLLQRASDFIIHRVPGVKFYLENRVGETFEQPAVIVSNHQSHLDLMCLMMLTPRIVFLTNDWVWRNPFYGMVIHRAEFYPVSNGIEHHVEQLRSLYERGYSICVFPEGTRSEDCSIQRFHKGAFYLASQLGADVLPVYLHGPGHVLPKRDFLLREGRIDVEVGSRVAVVEPLLDFTKTMRHHYQEHYQLMCERIETADYFAPYRKYVGKYTHGYDKM